MIIQSYRVVVIDLTPRVKIDDLIPPAHLCFVNLHISDRRGPLLKTHTLSRGFTRLQRSLCGAEWDMCAMMSCWEGEGGMGGGYIEMLMSPSWWRGQLEGHRGWRHVSPDMNHRRERWRDGGGLIQADQCPQALECCMCVCACVCVCVCVLSINRRVKEGN